MALLSGAWLSVKQAGLPDLIPALIGIIIIAIESVCLEPWGEVYDHLALRSSV